MTKKVKRASILAVCIYIMINSFVWGLMKAYINSYNAVNHEKLVMAQICESPDGKEISIMGNRFHIPSEAGESSSISKALSSLISVKIRTAAAIFMQTGQEIVQEALK